MRKNLTSVYAMHSIVEFAGSLVGIFIPAYLISLGYPPADVFTYFLVYAISAFFFFLGGAILARRSGVRIAVVASLPFTLGCISLLYLLHYTLFPLFLIGIAQGAGGGLYWFALNSFFAANVEEKVGTSVGKLFGFPQIVGLLGPLIGGVVALRFGFPALLVLVGFVFVLSSIPLIWIPELNITVTFRLRTFLNLFQKFKRYTLIEFVESIREELEGIVWPLFVFIAFRNALSVGIIGTLAGIGSILFTLVVGRYTDRINSKIFMRIGAVAMALLWFLRYLYPLVPLILYASTLVAGFLACLIMVPFTSFVYASAKQSNQTEFLIYREFPITIARVIIYSLALLIASVTNLFLVGVVVSAFILLF